MTNEELIQKTDKIIVELVRAKTKLKKAYNYYNGIRDADQFKYLEEQFGTSAPTLISFTPLIRKHIDAIVGEYLGTPIYPKIFCKDSDTIANINREKQLKISQELYNYLQGHLKNSILRFIDGRDIDDKLIEQSMKRIVEDINDTFMSSYEIAASDVLEYIMQSRETDIMTQLRTILLDLLVTGYTFYRVKPNKANNNIQIQALDPLNTFIDKNIESPYVKDSNRVVVRTWLTKEEILSRYGKEMSKKDRELLEDKWESIYSNAMYYVKMGYNDGIPITNGLEAGVEVTPGYPSSEDASYEYIPVYEVEWIEVDKNFVMQRYETIRIGEEIYILKGKNEDVIRSKSDPSSCHLSVNGVFLLNRNSEPYSLVLACADQQDRYDLLLFYRDNIIANSGTVGDWIDETLIPSHLGVDFPERLAKWISLKKQGFGILNTSEEGRLQAGAAPLNTIFNGFDDTVKYQAIQAIQLAIDATESTVSSITGVFRERLNGIEAHDAVTNVKISQNNSFVVTKQYNYQMDMVVNEMLLDSLNLAKIVFKNGLSGTYILGDKKQRIFTALPEYFTLTDFDVRIITSSDIIKDLEQIKSIIPEFVKSGGLPPDIILEALTSKSIPDLKKKIKRAITKAQEENNQLAQMSQKAEELENQLKETSKQLQQAQEKIEQLNQARIELEKQKLVMENKVEWFKAQTDKMYKEKMANEASKRTEVQIAQLYDNNPYNDKVVQIG